MNTVLFGCCHAYTCHGLGTVDEASAYMGGDWGGARSRLADRGIRYDLGHTSEDLANAQRGARKSLVHTGQLALGTIFDLLHAATLRSAWSAFPLQRDLSRRP